MGSLKISTELAFDRNFNSNIRKYKDPQQSGNDNDSDNPKVVRLNPFPLNEHEKCKERERVGRKLFCRKFGDLLQNSRSGISPLVNTPSKLQCGIKRSYKSSFDSDDEDLCSKSTKSKSKNDPGKIYDFKPDNMVLFPPSLFAYRQMCLIGVDRYRKQLVDHFAKLPDEMVLRIMKWLPQKNLGRFAQACKRFSKIVKDETLWRRIDVMNKIISPGNTGVIMSRNSDFLRMARAMVREPSGLETLVLTNPLQLVYLDLSSATIGTETLNRLLGMCHRLCKLSLEQLKITPEILTTMEVFSGTINTLNMTMCSGLQAQALSTFLSKAKGVTALNLGCILPNWTSEDLQLVISSIPIGMEFLNLAGFKNNMTNEHVKILVSRCSNLIDLDLSDCQRITGSSIQAVVELKELQHLALSRCYRIEAIAFGFLVDMQSLACLEIFHLLQDGIETLEAALPGVQINQYQFSSVARPSFGSDWKCIWNQQVAF